MRDTDSLGLACAVRRLRERDEDDRERIRCLLAPGHTLRARREWEARRREAWRLAWWTSVGTGLLVAVLLAWL